MAETLDDFWDYVLFDKAGNPRKPGEAMVQIARIVIGYNGNHQKEDLKTQSNKEENRPNWESNGSRLNKAYRAFKQSYQIYISKPPLKNIDNDCDNLNQCTLYIQKFISEQYNEKIKNKLSQKKKKEIDEKKMFMGNENSMKLRATDIDFIKFLNKHNKTRLDYILPNISNVKQDNESYETKNNISDEAAKKAVEKAIKSKERRKKKGIIGKLFRTVHAIKKGAKLLCDKEYKIKKQKREDDLRNQERAYTEAFNTDQNSKFVDSNKLDKLIQQADNNEETNDFNQNQQQTNNNKEKIAVKKVDEENLLKKEEETEERKHQKEKIDDLTSKEKSNEINPKKSVEDEVKENQSKGDSSKSNWYNYNKDSATVTIDNREINFYNVKALNRELPSNGTTDNIHLVIKNCIVPNLRNAFHDSKWINSLEIDSTNFNGIGFGELNLNTVNIKQSTISEYNFYGTTITTLYIESDTKVYEKGFYSTTIKDLKIDKNATVADGGFNGSTLTGAAKYDNNEDIPVETLFDWGFKNLLEGLKKEEEKKQEHQEGKKEEQEQQEEKKQEQEHKKKEEKERLKKEEEEKERKRKEEEEKERKRKEEEEKERKRKEEEEKERKRKEKEEKERKRKEEEEKERKRKEKEEKERFKKEKLKKNKKTVSGSSKSNWYNYNKDSATVIIANKIIYSKDVTELESELSLNSSKEITLVLKKCTVSKYDNYKGAFINCEWINSLEIDSTNFDTGVNFRDLNLNTVDIKQSTIPMCNFGNTTITNLYIDSNTTVDENGFYVTTIRDLKIDKNATVAEGGFKESTLTGTAKYNNDEDIPVKTLDDWGFENLPERLKKEEEEKKRLEKENEKKEQEHRKEEKEKREQQEEEKQEQEQQEEIDKVITEILQIELKIENLDDIIECIPNNLTVKDIIDSIGENASEEKQALKKFLSETQEQVNQLANTKNPVDAKKIIERVEN